jgi:hypothetical protein
MSTYTVHEPPLKRYDALPDPERFVFVRDGFSFWVFLLAPLWMLRHRMWLVLLGYIVVFAAVQTALHFVGASITVRFFAGFLLALLVGIEAGTLRRFTLARRGFVPAGVVVGDDVEAAEHRFFDAWVKSGAIMPAPPPNIPTWRRNPATSDVIGLFPEPGPQR